MQQGKGDELAFCPSFNFYTSDGLAAIAAKVSREVIAEEDSDESNRGEEFEFSVEFENGDFTADETEVIFRDGKIQQVFPIFNRDLLVNDGERYPHHRGNEEVKETEDDSASTIRIPLEKLFIDNREGEEEAPTISTSSSSESDESETEPSRIYCMWTPKSPTPSLGKVKKSSSTGSGSGSVSKRWNLRGLLRRCNSDGKEPVMFVAAKKSEKRIVKVDRSSNPGDGVKLVEKPKAAGGNKSKSSAHEAFYVRNRAEKQVGKRRSYLPYRQDLVGLFAGVNIGMSRNFH